MDRQIKPRPALFKALGNQEPPAEVTVGGVTYHLVDIYKHDSWAATGFYEGAEHGIICKFNRTQSIFFLPMQWLGRFLAHREMFAYEKLSGISGIIAGCGPVLANGKVWRNVAAHRFMPGHPLGEKEKVSESFFRELLETIRAVHERGFAYVDLHKRENILVGEDSKPYLIDFQISFYASDRSIWWPVLRPVLRVLQRSDLYHLAKHVKRLRPDLIQELGLESIVKRPWWIRAHRTVAVPFRSFRRRLLTTLNVRGKSGRSSTEVFAEHAFRCDQERAA